MESFHKDLRQSADCKQLKMSIPSNTHISTTFFGKKVVFSKICLGSLKIFGVMYKFGIYVIMKSSLQFQQCKGQKGSFPLVSKLPPLCQTPTHRRIYLCKSFHSDMPNFDTVLLNKQDWCKSKYGIRVLQHKIPPKAKAAFYFLILCRQLLSLKISSEKRCRS